MLPIYPLTTEQTEIQNLARDFASREIVPQAQLYERESLRQGDLLGKICQSGLVNTRIPEEFGGPGLSLLETCLIAEELAFACSGISSAAEASELAITYLLLAGSPEQKSKYLSVLTESNGLAGLALSSNYEISKGDKLWATLEKNSIVLNGYCPLVLNATFAKWLIVTCPLFEISPEKNKKYDSAPKSACFIVPNNMNGVAVLDPIASLGRQASDVRPIRFTKVELEPMAKLNMPSLQNNNNIAFVDIFDISLPVNSTIIASACLGLANAAFSQAKKYAQGRKTFGIPIAEHQAIAFMVADMISDIEATRMITYAAIESVTNVGNNFKIAISNLAFALEMASRVTNDAVQIFGGYGYTKDYQVEKLMRDAKAYQLFYGNSKTEYLAQSLKI